MIAMLADVHTVIWKEWRELISRTRKSEADMIKTIAVVVLLLGLTVWRASFFMANLGVLVVPSFVVVQLLAGLMADSFAGERERHTLETLLASRLSDLAILTGKIAAGVILIWGAMVVMLTLGVVSVHFHNEAGTPPLALTRIVAILIFYLLFCLLMSCAAVLVSLRASTVRQAMQTLTWSFMGVFFIGIFAASRLSPEWRAALLRALAGENLLRTELIAGTILSGLILVLFLAARLRFQRARLILD